MSATLWTIALFVCSLGVNVRAQSSSGCDELLSWVCDNGECIGKNERCNGKVDCSDGSDETVEECISAQCRDDKFRCSNGACVVLRAECNGRKDCADNSDELTKKCLPNIGEMLRGNCSLEMFQCRSGECIPLDKLCDGRVECSDRSDESVDYCASKCCPPFGFRCGYGGCINKKYRCDGYSDCADDSDENYLLCGYTKAQSSSGCDKFSSWVCDNGECIKKNERCDGKVDCSDGSDETVTACISFKCRDDKFRCSHGACVELEAECDGKTDCADNSDELTKKCLPNIGETLRGKCSGEMFQCRSGECIPLDKLCDGRIECSDRSDESVEYCTSKCCPTFGFRCGYGGCIDKKYRCDGYSDCADESDENYLLCGYPKPSTTSISTPKPNKVTTVNHASKPTYAPDKIFYPDSSELAPGACRINRIPKNGWIEKAAPPNDKLSLGEVVAQWTQVNYKCLHNHLTKGSNMNNCFNGTWLREVPDCNPFCSTKAITGVSIVASTCSLNGVGVRCEDPAEPGTIAHINCRDRYERDVGAKAQTISCSDDATWFPLPIPCTAICGEESPEGTPYVVGGHKGSITQVPWHVALYKYREGNYEFQCGGTIVNARVIISAMHCFWDPSENKPYNESLFRVVAGKGKLNINAKEDYATQQFEVERIFYDENYNDATGNYAADVVMIILKTPIEFKSYIAPICIPYGLTYEDRVVPPGWQGRVAGWGLTSSGGKPSEQLKIVELPSIERGQCIRESDIGFVPQITPDKFCAGYLNTNVSVCQGDSGGGLVFPKMEARRTHYYLRGIVSTGASKSNSCDADKYSTFTNILYYEKFIETYDVRYRPR